MRRVPMRRMLLGLASVAALTAGTAAAQAQWGYDGPNGPYAPTPYGYYGSDNGTYFNNAPAPRGGTYKSRAFRSQELLPQSPPSGGY